MTGDPSYQSQEAIDAYTALYATLARGYSRFYGALIASSRLTLAAILAFRQKQELGPDESRATNILGIIKHIDHESFDSFMYVEYVSHLVYATSLLDTFLTETTTFLFLLFPQAMGKSHQVPLKLLIDSDSRSAALTQAAHTRAREISFKAISDRLGFLRESFGLNITLDDEIYKQLLHFVELRNSAVHDQGILGFSLDDSGKINFTQKTCARHPTELTEKVPEDAAKVYQRVCNIVARAVFIEVLKCESQNLPELLLKRTGEPASA